MHLSIVGLMPRRILNSPYHHMKPLPSTGERWWKRQRLFRLTSFFEARHRNVHRIARQLLHERMRLQTIFKQDTPLYENYIHKTRVIAALEEHKMNYNAFKKMLYEADIQLSEQVLADLAVWEPRTFKSLTMLSKRMAIDQQLDGIVDLPSPENVHISNKL